MKKILIFAAAICLFAPAFSDEHKADGVVYYFNGDGLNSDNYEPDFVSFYKKMDKIAKSFEYQYVNIFNDEVDAKEGDPAVWLKSGFEDGNPIFMYVNGKAGQYVGMIFSDNRYPNCKNFFNISGDAYEKARKAFEIYIEEL